MDGIHVRGTAMSDIQWPREAQRGRRAQREHNPKRRLEASPGDPVAKANVSRARQATGDTAKHRDREGPREGVRFLSRRRFLSGPCPACCRCNPSSRLCLVQRLTTIASAPRPSPYTIPSVSTALSWSADKYSAGSPVPASGPFGVRVGRAPLRQRHGARENVREEAPPQVGRRRGQPRLHRQRARGRLPHGPAGRAVLTRAKGIPLAALSAASALRRRCVSIVLLRPRCGRVGLRFPCVPPLALG